MKQNHKLYDAIVVGGGHNGLVAASYLAKAGKAVLLLEAQDELGGATTSVKPFPEYDARLSRYSYLVSLLPDQLVADLGINFKTLERSVASYTPYQQEGREDGLLVSTEWDEPTASSFRRLTGSDREGVAWRDSAMRDGFRPTDDSALYEKYLGPVPIVPGDPNNVKITTPEDLTLCEAILRVNESKRARRS